MSKNLKKILFRTILLAINIALIVISFLIKKSQNNCEFLTKSVGRFYQTYLGQLVAKIPFSLTEILGLAAIVLTLIFLISSIRNLFKVKLLKALRKLLNLLVMASSILCIYSITAEFAYNRVPLEINYYEEDVDKTKFKEIINYFVEDINVCCSKLTFDEKGEIVSNLTVSELSDLCAAEYETIKDNAYFTEFTTTCKPMLSSFLYREFHITGLTFMPTTEANVNTLNVEGGKPFTFMHELAHTKGVMRENDAQQVAMCLCLKSNNPYLRFSGYYYTFSSLLYLANFTGVDSDYNDLVSKLDSKFINYYRYSSEYWSNYHLLDDFAEWWNNLYLKFSGVEEGTDSYSDSPTIVTPTEITFSNYQKIYFQIYYQGDLL